MIFPEHQNEVRELRQDLVRCGLLRSLWGYGVRQRLSIDTDELESLVTRLREMRGWFDPEEDFAVERIVGLGGALIGMDKDPIRSIRDQFKAVGAIYPYRGSTQDMEYRFDPDTAMVLIRGISKILQEAGEEFETTVGF